MSTYSYATNRGGGMMSVEVYERFIASSCCCYRIFNELNTANVLQTRQRRADWRC